MDFVFEPIDPKMKRCGCYAINPELIKLYENKRILMPLRSCDYQIEIVNAMVNVTLTQTYQNPTEQFLQVEYSFPISPEACVYRFVATFGNTRVEGVVKEKEEAKAEYQKAVTEGRRAAYGEVSADSKDIMNLKVGNIAPAELVRIEVVYLQMLGLSLNTFFQLRLPATITPRYASQIPKEHILAGYRKEPSQQTLGTFSWSFQINLRSSRKVIFHDSHTHKLQLISQNDTRTESVFVLENPCIPNTDFVFSYTTEDFQLPNCVLGRTDKSSSAVLSFIPKFCSLSIDDAYKASVENKSFEGDIDTARAEYIFLLDRSGSMGGARITKAKEALVLFIKSLPQDSYFNVVSFGSGSRKLFQQSRKYVNKDIEYAVSQIKNMGADMGGTEIYHPLFALLKQKPIEGYPKQIFLLTDGGVDNTEGVIKMVGNNNKYARVHSIGIGNGASQSLIKGCATKGKGLHVFINDQEDPSEKIIQLLTDSLSAVITKMSLDFDESVVESIIPNPKLLPFILKGEIVNFFVTFKGQLSTKAAFAFSYEDSLNKLPFASKIEVDPESPNESFVDRMGHFKRIKVLEDSHANNTELQDHIYYAKKVDKKQEIIRESVEHQILSEFTAFICVQKELIDGKYQQIKQTGKVKVTIESPPPIQYKQRSSMPPPSANRPITSSGNPRAYNLSSPISSLQQQDLMLKSQCKSYQPRQQMVMQSRSIKSSMAPIQQSKKKQSQGYASSISDFFKNLLMSKPQKKPNTQMRSNIAYDDQCDGDEDEQAQAMFLQLEKQMAKQTKKNPYINKEKQKKQEKEKEHKSERKQEEKKIKQKQQIKEVPLKKDTNLINSIVSEQDSLGFWKNLSLISKLFSSEVEKAVRSEKNPEAAAAYLIAKWIEKHFPQKQYSLIVKKALNYAQKEAQNFKDFPSLYDKFLS